MSKKSDDLNSFDLGLPDFGVAEPAQPLPETTSPPTEATASTATNSAENSASTAKPVAKAAVVAATASKPAPVEKPVATPQSVKKKALRGIWAAVPSWAISTVVHVAAILVLAAWNIEPIKEELKLMLVSAESIGETDALDEFSIDDAMASEMESTQTEDQPIDAPVIESNLDQAIVAVDYNEVLAPAMPEISATSLTQALAPKSALSAQASAATKASLTGRGKEVKRDLLKKFGGSSDTEKAVAAALKWLARHQDPESGAWTLQHTLVCNGQCDRPGSRRNSMNAATGLALMCFLGAGQTHLEGEHKETVLKGLSFLIKNIKVQKGMGSWWAGDGAAGFDDMYAHGIATTVMCEAYGMTKDPQLLEAAQLGVNYLAYAQNPSTGGWHYSPYPLGKMLGDTSVVGWQMMALKSAAMSGLEFDLDMVRRANVFLDSMSFEDGSSYHYDFTAKAENRAYNPGTTSCAILCRMYSGFPKNHPSIVAAVKKFNDAGPSNSITYYNYYATQVMKQYGGPEWESWNVRMRDQLLSTQVPEKSGHAGGSWYWDDGYHTECGGRLYTTCMATMILEVYYRYLPIYGDQTEEDAFQL